MHNGNHRSDRCCRHRPAGNSSPLAGPGEESRRLDHAPRALKLRQRERPGPHPDDPLTPYPTSCPTSPRSRAVFDLAGVEGMAPTWRMCVGSLSAGFDGFGHGSGWMADLRLAYAVARHRSPIRWRLRSASGRDRGDSRLVGEGAGRDAFPEVHRRALVQDAHTQGLAPPVF